MSMSGLFTVLTSLVVFLDCGGLSVPNITDTQYVTPEINGAEYGRTFNDNENNTTYNKTVSFTENVTLPIPGSQKTDYTGASSVHTFSDIFNASLNNSLTSNLNHSLNSPPTNEQMVPVVKHDPRTREHNASETDSSMFTPPDNEQMVPVVGHDSRTREHNGTQNNSSESDSVVFAVDVPYNWDFSTKDMFSDSESILETTTESDRITTVHIETDDVHNKTATDTINTTESVLISQTISKKSQVNVSESQTACTISRGWNLKGTDWGCCGNYDDCCTYASLFCYIHDAICKCCDIGNNFCGPLCKPDPDCKETVEFDGNTQREVEETNSDSYSDGSGEIEDNMPPTGKR